MVRGDEGFTLIELTITVAMLGIVTGIVVLSVGGIATVGEDTSCESDRKTLEIAASTYLLLEEIDEFTGAGSETFEEALVSQGVIRGTSNLHDLDPAGNAVPVDDRCTT